MNIVSCVQPGLPGWTLRKLRRIRCTEEILSERIRLPLLNIRSRILNFRSRILNFRSRILNFRSRILNFRIHNRHGRDLFLDNDIVFLFFLRLFEK